MILDTVVVVYYELLRQMMYDYSNDKLYDSLTQVMVFSINCATSISLAL